MVNIITKELRPLQPNVFAMDNIYPGGTHLQEFVAQIAANFDCGVLLTIPNTNQH
jgi:hypothetical protein